MAYEPCQARRGRAQPLLAVLRLHRRQRGQLAYPGGPRSVVPGETDRPGCIRHIWATTTERDNNSALGPAYLLGRRGLLLPSLSSRGLFFGLGHAKGNYWQPLPAILLSWHELLVPNALCQGLPHHGDERFADRLVPVFLCRLARAFLDVEPADLGVSTRSWKRELVTGRTCLSDPTRAVPSRRYNTDGSGQLGRARYGWQGPVRRLLPAHRHKRAPGWWARAMTCSSSTGNPGLAAARYRYRGLRRSVEL